MRNLHKIAKPYISAAWLSVLMLLAGCAGATPPTPTPVPATATAAPPAAAPQAGVDIRGLITLVSPGNQESEAQGRLGSILVEGVKEADTHFDKASVAVTDQTQIIDRSSGTDRPATFPDLQSGQRVEARFTGEVAESYPVQAVATEIIILE